MGIQSYFMATFYDAMMKKSEALCRKRWRSELLGQVTGDVLEVGTGTGLNLRHYPEGITSLVLSEPNADMRVRLERRLRETGREQVTVTGDPADHIDLPDESFDSIVSTLVLCSVGDQAAALSEVYRLLRPGGRFFFIEHVAARDNPKVARWQGRLEGLWRFCCGNCHLTRDTEQAILDAGLVAESIEQTLMLGAPAVVESTIKGIARKPGAEV